MLSFSRTFSNIVHPSDILVLAVSGGVDSMVLLDLVRKFHPSENIVVVHFDHSLRWAESDGDREFIADFCKRENLAFETKKVDIATLATEHKGSLEAVARKERYDFLEAVRRQYNAKFIITAHHADDQIETMVLNMIKGGKSQGISGMSTVSWHIFRPMLEQTKEEILHYAAHCHVPYREDSSNMDVRFERNKIRLEVLPVFREINPSIHRTFHHLAAYMQEVTEYFDHTSTVWLRDAEVKSGKKNTFLISDFCAVHPFFGRELIAHLYREAHNGSSQGLSTKLITELIRFITDGSNSHGKKDIGKLHLERRGERIIY